MTLAPIYGFFRRFRDHLWQSASSYTQHVGGLLLGLVLARILNPEVFGEFAMVSSLVLMLQIPFTWSLSQKLLASRLEDSKILRDSWRLAGWVFVGKALPVFGICIWYVINQQYHLSLLALVIGIPPCFYEYITLLRIECEVDRNFQPNFIASAISIGAILFLAIPLALFGLGSFSLALPGLAITPILLTVYRKSTQRQINRFIGLGRVKLKNFFDGAFLWIIGNCEVALTRFDKLALGQYSNNFELGNYTRAQNYSPAAHLSLSSLYTNATIAALSRQVSNRNKMKTLVKIACILTLAGWFNWVVLKYYSAPIVAFLFGEKWISAIPVFEAFAPLSLCFAAFYLPATFLISVKHFSGLATARILGLACFILIIIYNREGMNGVVMAQIFCYGLFLSGFFSFSSIIYYLWVFPRLRTRMRRNLKKDSEEQISQACTYFRA